MLRLWCALVSSLLVLAGVARAAGEDVRFSHSVSPADRAAMGLDRLNSDQLAILDALVRRDATSRLDSETEAAKAPGRFSTRLSAGERTNTGLAGFTPEQLAKLDAAVEKHGTVDLARALLAPPVFVDHRSAARPDRKAQKGLDVHGSVSLSYGWGKGYNVKSGSMIVNMSDPAQRYSITLGYGETHVSGNGEPPLLLPPVRPDLRNDRMGPGMGPFDDINRQ
jgi:hypothetical protein